MTAPDRHHGILLLAYGTPDSPDDLPDYLLDVRRGRPFTNELLDELRGRYAAIGGISPLTRITADQAAAVAAELAGRGHQVPVVVGMRHWRPRIATALEQLRSAGVTSATVLILAPHNCYLTFDLYRGGVETALKELDYPLDVSWVRAWSAQHALIAAQADVLKTALREVPRGRRTKVVFSAHSLPEQRLRDDDPYHDDLLANAAAIIRQSGRPELDWSFAFQSAGASGGPWLGPDINDCLADYAAEGVEWLVSMPIGFVADHLEILFDLDIETRAVAKRHGLGFTRAPMMNTHPLFIRAIADALLEADGASA